VKALCRETVQFEGEDSFRINKLAIGFPLLRFLLNLHVLKSIFPRQFSVALMAG